MDEYLITKERALDRDDYNPFNSINTWDDKRDGTERFNYFQKRINEFEGNDAIKYDIFKRLLKASGILFNWAYYQDKNRDCFIEVVDALFDSDSYSELNSKLDAIDSASRFCQTARTSTDIFKKLLERLKSDQYKDVYNGKIIKYGDTVSKHRSLINGIYKPRRIIDRMKELYGDELFLDEVHRRATSIEDMVLFFGKNDLEYRDFCHNYIEKIEKDIEDKCSFYPTSDEKLEVVKVDVGEGFYPLSANFDPSNLIERKNYIIRMLKELGLKKDFRDKFISCYGKNEYSFLNLYMIAIAYEFQRNSFKNFEAILDDISVIPDYCTDFTLSDYFKYYVGYFLACEDYKDMIDMRKSFSFFLNSFDGRYYDKVVSNVVHRCDYLVDSKDPYIRNEIYGLNMRKAIEGREIYFNPLFVKERDRLSYINNKLHEIESNPSIREEMFFSIRQLVVVPFGEFNFDRNTDSFIEYMDIIFDSDTYREFYNKLKHLQSAGRLYERGDRIEALQMLKDLNSTSHKEAFRGKIISYPGNCMNRIVKPKRIIDRMKELYSKVDDSISYDFLDEVHKYATWSTDINTSIKNHQKNPFNHIKQKLKRKVNLKTSGDVNNE